MAKRKRKSNLSGNDVGKLSNKSRKPVATPSLSRLSIPRQGSIWKHVKDGSLFTVVSNPIHVAVQGYVTIECKESEEYTNKVDMLLDMFYHEFTLYKNNIPSKLEGKCICVDYINNNPDSISNPDCPIHGTLSKLETIKEVTQ